MGPNGARIERALKFQTYTMGADGTHRLTEIPGAPNLIAWMQCWEIMKTAAIMSSAITPVAMDRYAGEFAQHCRRYPECWHICALADIRCRTEYWPQVKRKLEAFHIANPAMSSFDPGMPWNSVVRDSVDFGSLDFWVFEVREPAKLFKFSAAGMAMGNRQNALPNAEALGAIPTIAKGDGRRGGNGQAKA